MDSGAVFPACFRWKRRSVDPVFPAVSGFFYGKRGGGGSFPAEPGLFNI